MNINEPQFDEEFFMDSSDLEDDIPQPQGELTLQTVAMPADTNANGDIFGGWLLSQMDLAAGVAAAKIAKGRVATVAINSMAFLTPVSVGSVVSCYCEVLCGFTAPHPLSQPR